MGHNSPEERIALRMDRSIDVVMPQFGMGMSEGVITTWHVNLGDAVTHRQVIADIEIEKTDVELEAPASGRIVEILVNAGESAVVQQVLARIDPIEPT